MKNIFKSRNFQYGSLSVMITAAFLAVIILLNLLVGAASAKFPLTVDLTREKVFALSQQSIDYLDGLQKPVEITVMSDALTLESSGGYYAQAKNIIDQYGKHSGNVKVTYLNPTANPGFVSQYPELDLGAFDVLVTSGQKSAKVTLTSLFNLGYDRATGQQYIKSSKAEQEITSAIMRVISDKTVKVLLLNGQEESYPQELRTLLEKNGYELAEQSLLTDTLDATADLAFLLAPQRDLTLEMLAKLDSWMENGGQYGKQLIYAPHPTADGLANLDAWLAQWGIRVEPTLVMESDPQRYANGQPFYCLTDYTSQDYTQNLLTTAPLLSPLGRGLTTLFDYQSAYTVTTLLSYSPGSYAMPMTADQNWQPTRADLGARPALVRSSLTQYQDNKPYTSNLFAVSSVGAFGPIALQSSSVANAEYLLAMLGEITQRTDIITIAPKNLAGTELGINQYQFLFFTILFAIVLPLVVVGVGLVIWLRRRNR